MSQVWKTIPLFISSTFRDMHAERDQLNRVVFPAIEELLKPRRCRIAPIDLRVGVETDSTRTERERELQILKVCLAEIERSRPFLLVLLGDRYGWVPGEERIKAASSEAGFTPEDNGGSVTALEIEYGLLKKDPVQRRRCLLCLREPLPCDRMPEDKAIIYSDAHATDPFAPDRVARLKKLKAKINADPELAPHRHPYKLDWDETKQQPKADGDHGIKMWGQKVEKALWDLLDEETKSFAAQAEPTWEEQERFAIEEQVERLNGSFVGRQPLIQRALELAGSATTQGAATGLVFTGGSGTGKSALFARLHHELSQHQNILLLAHAAGVSSRSGQTEWMLRRWIGELGAALGETPDVPENIKPEDLEKLFTQLLQRVAAKRRVVVLVDALNQFLRTERASTVSWLPITWPTNARFIATTISGEESTHLAQRPGLTLVDVPPLDSSEAETIAAQVYGRYRRTPNAEVLRAVLALHQTDGTPAAGNPLWLTLALDLLNLLDADDFSVVESAVGGSAEERLRRLVLDRARELPPDMEGLYGRLLAQVEKVAGLAETRAFAALTALSRHGWREEDLEKLLPNASVILSKQQSAIGNPQCKWDPLRFAVLRRCFRAHLVKRGALEQWDFAHASLRRAVLARLDGEWNGRQSESLTRSLYSSGADYLETLPPGTGVRSGEIMWQMLGTRDGPRVARYYAQPASFHENFAEYLIEDITTPGEPLLKFVLSLPAHAAGDDAVAESICKRFFGILQEVLSKEGFLLLRIPLIAAGLVHVEKRVSACPGEVKWLELQVLFLTKMGDLLTERGSLEEAIGNTTRALAIAQRLAESDPTNVKRSKEIVYICNRLGHLAFTRGSFQEAEQHFRVALGINGRLASAQADQAEAAHSLIESYCCLGDLAQAKNHLIEAERNFSQALATARLCAERNPDDTDNQAQLCGIFERLGTVVAVQGKTLEAAQHYSEGLAVALHFADSPLVGESFKTLLGVLSLKSAALAGQAGKLGEAIQIATVGHVVARGLAERNPTSVSHQSGYALACNALGQFMLAVGRPQEAEEHMLESLAIQERLAGSNPDEIKWQDQLCFAHKTMGEFLASQGRLAQAEEHYFRALSIRKLLAEREATDENAKNGLFEACQAMAEVCKAQGKPTEAMRYAQEALDASRRPNPTLPLDSELRLTEFVALDQLAQLAFDAGRLAEAGQYVAQMIDFALRLHRANPTSLRFMAALARGYRQAAELASTQGKLADALKNFTQGRDILETLARSNPKHCEIQTMHAHNMLRLAVTSSRLGEQASAQDDLAKFHKQLKHMQTQGIALDPELRSAVSALDAGSSLGYTKIIAAMAGRAPSVATSHPASLNTNAGATATPQSPPSFRVASATVSQPIPPSLEELRMSATRCFQNGQWEAAATQLERLFQQNEPIDKVAPKLITCLLNAHETPLESDVKRIEALLQNLEQGGHVNLAAPLRQQLQAKLPRKKGWKFW